MTCRRSLFKNEQLRASDEARFHIAGEDFLESLVMHRCSQVLAFLAIGGSKRSELHGSPVIKSAFRGMLAFGFANSHFTPMKTRGCLSGKYGQDLLLLHEAQN